MELVVGTWRSTIQGVGLPPIREPALSTRSFIRAGRENAPYEIDETRRKLLNWYDVLPWVTNLKNTKTVAYSGEVDKQKQAADRVISSVPPSGRRCSIRDRQRDGTQDRSLPRLIEIESVIDRWSQKSVAVAPTRH